MSLFGHVRDDFGMSRGQIITLIGIVADIEEPVFDLCGEQALFKGLNQFPFIVKAGDVELAANGGVRTPSLATGVTGSW